MTDDEINIDESLLRAIYNLRRVKPDDRQIDSMLVEVMDVLHDNQIPSISDRPKGEPIKCLIIASGYSNQVATILDDCELPAKIDRLNQEISMIRADF